METSRGATKAPGVPKPAIPSTNAAISQASDSWTLLSGLKPTATAWLQTHLAAYEGTIILVTRLMAPLSRML